jgi:NADH-quinone oxidoreductase subunit N
MSPEFLQAAAADNQWAAIFPELMLGCLALLLLVLEIVLPKRQHGLIPTVAILGQAAVLLAVLSRFGSLPVDVTTFNGLLRHTAEGHFFRVLFLLTGALVSGLGVIALARQKLPRIEFFAITLVVTAAMMLLGQANHFVLLFVALETVTIGFYVLVAYTRTNPLSLEAGLKYLIMGALSSAILLFGIALLYGVAGLRELPGSTDQAMNFEALRLFLSANPDNLLAALGIGLVLAGVAFKVGAVPFQIWIPDVYQGAPTPVTAFLAVGSKAAGFALLLILVRVFAPYAWMVIPVLTVMAVATILFGNLAALTQHNVKRLIGLSGVAHAGYLLVGVVAAQSTSLAVGAMLFYLFAYLLASFAVFGVMTHLAGDDDADQQLDHYHELGRTHPFLAGVLAVGLGSLAGIPPLAGFMGKLMIFLAAFQAELYLLLGVAVVGVVVSIYYYFGWLKAAFFPTWRPAPVEGEPTPPAPVRREVGVVAGATLAALAFASILIGFYQGGLGEWLLLR